MALLERIKHHEGFRSKAYFCSENHLTIGYGFAIKDLELDEDIAEQILQEFGFRVLIALGLGYFLWKQQNWIQHELIKELEERFKRLEGIIISLINQQKKMQIELRGILKKYEALVEIINKLIIRNKDNEKTN